MSDERTPGEPEPEVARLDDWGAGWSAPPELRSSVLAAARERGLVGGRTMNRWALGVAAAAVALVMFGAGFGVGSIRVPAPREEASVATTETTAAGPRYALFLFEDASYQAPAPEAMGERVAEYGRWARGLGESGRYVAGEKLAEDGRFCRIENGELVAAGPFAEATRGVLAGYFVVGAASLEEAVALARGCPHLKYGGSVEVRQLETT